MSHVDEGRLHAFLDGALSAADPADAERVELHLAACADCRAKLEEAARLRDEATALLGIAEPQAFEMPSFEAIRARAAAIAASEATSGGVDGSAEGSAQATPAAGPRRSGRAFFASPFNGIAWAATVVLAVGLGWMLHDTTDERGVRPMTDMSGRTVQSTQPGGADAISEESSVAETANRSQASTDADRPGPAASGAVAGAGAGAGGAPARTEEYSVETFEALQAAPPPASVRSEPRRAAGEPLGGQPARVAREQAAPPARSLPSAAPPPPAEVFAEDGAVVAWDIVSVAEAERRAGGELFVLRDARLTSVGVRDAGADLQVRTVQRTSRGETIELVQRRVPHAGADAMAMESAAADEPRKASGSALTVRRDEWMVTISGAVDPDRLQELIDELP